MSRRARLTAAGCVAALATVLTWGAAASADDGVEYRNGGAGTDGTRVTGTDGTRVTGTDGTRVTGTDGTRVTGTDGTRVTGTDSGTLT